MYPSIQVGAPHYASGNAYFSGSAWVLFLNTDGSVISSQEITGYDGAFTGDAAAAKEYYMYLIIFIYFCIYCYSFSMPL